ncbi:MAG: hypothetical protein OEY29_06455 [Gammaproteobacteria bacterium]|nr:hypothetical protein [Gammaproteobacteria bacterium]
MSEDKKSAPQICVKQIDHITPANKRYMIFFTTAVVMLSVAVIITSYTI